MVIQIKIIKIKFGKLQRQTIHNIYFKIIIKKIHQWKVHHRNQSSIYMAIKENNHELNVMNVKYKDLKDENRKLSRQLKLLKNKKLEEVNYWDLLL